jgi:hypothetical protein
VLTHAGARFETETIELDEMGTANAPSLAERRKLGSVRGLFPVLRVDGTPIPCSAPKRARSPARC